MEAPRLGVVLDAGAVIALFRDEPSAARVDRLLRDAHARMATVNAAEVVDVLVRVYGLEADDVVAAVEDLLSTTAEPVTPSVERSTRAGELRARHFDRRRGRLSLADCFALATSEGGETLVTTDGTLAAAARDEDVDVILLGE